MKNKIMIISMLCIFLITSIIFQGCVMKNAADKSDGLFEIEFVGELEIDNNDSELQYFYGRGKPDTLYLIEANKESEDYILRSKPFSIDLNEIESQYNIKIDYRTNDGEYFIISYGSKIDKAYMSCVDDISQEKHFETSFLANVIYNKEFDKNKLYLYKIDRTDLWFIPIVSVIAEYGDNNEIKLVQKDINTVDLNFNIPWEKNPYSLGTSYDPTREVKIYYYKYEAPYLYTINKWGRYMVIDTDKAKIISREYNICNIPPKYREVFEKKSEFTDISVIDDNIADNTYKLGDGTLVFTISANYVNLVNEKDRVISHYTVPFASRIKYCLIENEYVYIIDHNGYYKVVDRSNYIITERSKEIKDISVEHRMIFDNIDNFLSEEELRKMIVNAGE